jgi:hypothetical protein
MVFYKRNALRDIEQMRHGLLLWQRATLTKEFIHSYINDLRKVCESIDKKQTHSPATYRTHRRYGSFVHEYRRNRRTVWFIIYDIDVWGNAFINKIISNYMTIN